MDFHCVIPLAPKPKARPRFSRGRAYMASDYTQWKDKFRKYVETEWGVPALECHCVLNIVFYSSSLRPDIDNACGSILDALNGLVWKDDRQVKQLSALWRPWTGEPKISIHVTTRFLGDA